MNIRTILVTTTCTLAAIVGATLLLPETVVVERKQVIKAQQEKIFALLDSAAGFQRFNPYKEADPKLEIALGGPDRGIGSSLSFDGTDGKGVQTIVDITPNSRVKMEIDLGAMGKPVQEFELTPVDGGTEVVWRVTSGFGFNPVGRVFGLFMDGMLGPIQERGLEKMEIAVAA